MTLDAVEWEDLLRYIRAHRVLPIIGPDLVTVPDGDTNVPLVRWLAPRLAEQLHLPDAASYTRLNNVACDYLATRKSDRRKIYNGIRTLLEKQQFPIPQPLLQLAAIIDFDLLITTTFDSLLIQAMEQQRPGFARSRDVFRFDTRPSSRPFPDPVRDSLVYHILGDLDCFPDFCVWEEDYMEYLCCLIAQRHDPSMEGLFKLLADRHLLLLGAPYSDWVVHFFLRAARGSRLTGARKDDATEIIADSPAVLGTSTIFFNNTVQATSLIDSTPADFVAELSRRWQAEQAVSAQDFLQRMEQEMPQGAVFLSYSRDDLTAAQNLAMTLKTANIPVWMDKERLQVGDSFRAELEIAIRSRCSYFIALISPATESDQHRYVHRERAWAAQRHVEGFVFYLPLILEGTPEPRLEPQCFAGIHRETITKDGTPNTALVEQLRRLMERWRDAGCPRAGQGGWL